MDIQPCSLKIIVSYVMTLIETPTRKPHFNLPWESKFYGSTSTLFLTYLARCLSCFIFSNSIESPPLYVPLGTCFCRVTYTLAISYNSINSFFKRIVPSLQYLQNHCYIGLPIQGTIAIKVGRAQNQ